VNFLCHFIFPLDKKKSFGYNTQVNRSHTT